MHVRKLTLALLVLLLARGLSPVDAKVLSREEALRLAFPGADIRPIVVFLTDAEKKAIAELSHEKVESALVASYRATQKGTAVGRAYLDTHIVRTKKESVLVILHADGRVRRVEIVAFLEPPEYIPPDLWYQQFENKSLSDDLDLQGQIRPVTGATLTAQATTAAVRRVLATDLVLQKRAKQP